MKPLSTKAKDLIGRLCPIKHRNWLGLLRASDPEQEALISAIGELGEARAILDLVAFVLDRRRSIARVAAEAIHRLLRGASSYELLWLDGAFREYRGSSFAGLKSWSELRPADLTAMESFGEASFSLLALLSFHANGFVRQEAIVRLASRGGGKEIPFLLIRMNDWVEMVRTVVRKLVSDRLVAGHLGWFLESLPLVSRLEGPLRVDHSSFIEEINLLLRCPEGRATIMGCLSSNDRSIRREALKLLLEDFGCAVEAGIVRRCLEDEDPLIRLRTARKITTLLEGREAEAAAVKAVNDRVASVRLEAVRAIVKVASASARDVLMRALVDRTASLRHEARYHLAKEGPCDFAARYRDALLSAQGNGLIGVIEGLAETGSQADVPRITPFIEHRLARVSSAAVRALAKLDGKGSIPVCLNAITSGRAGPCKAAAQALSRWAHGLDPELVWNSFRTCPGSHSKIRALSLIAALRKWDSLPRLLTVCSFADKELVRVAMDHLHLWIQQFNREFSTPTTDQVRSARSALRRASAQLNPVVRKELTILLEGL